MENKESIGSKEETERKPRKINFWVISTIVLAILLLSTLIFGSKITGNAISSQEASSKVLDIINNYYTQDGTATLSGVSEESGLYNVEIIYQNQKIPIFITKDGKYISSPVGIPMTNVEDLIKAATQNKNQSQTEENVPKADKPIVELFVMSFCPYGVKAENNIMPIIDLLGNKIDFKIKFIVNVGGQKIEDVSSLHGINEAKEDARQVVIMKDYPDKYYAYLKEFDNNCYSIASDATKLDECWKNAAKKLGLDANKIETAAYGEEGINLLKQDEADANKYGVSGSPTLMINGVKSSAIYSGTEATQSAICSAFNTAPNDCNTAVNATAASSNQPSGSCG